MICVLEGADGVGKTTLAREFMAAGFRYAHNGPPKPGADMFEVYTRQLLDAQKRGDDVVFDRLHLGEHVYGEHVRGRAGLTVAQLKVINRLLFARGGALVICHTADDTVAKNWQKRCVMEYITGIDVLVRINRAYGHLALRVFCGYGVHVYDYTLHNRKKFVTDLIAVHKQEYYRRALL